MIGLPGDRIRIHRGNASVNGIPLGSRVAPIEASGPEREPLQLHRESLGGRAYTVARDPKPPTLGSGDTATTVPADRYFLLGDNRDHSYDSRYWGTVHRGDVIGRASHVYFSRDPNGGVRWERIGVVLE